MSTAAFAAARHSLHQYLISQHVLGFVEKKSQKHTRVVATFADASQESSREIGRQVLNNLGIVAVFPTALHANTLGGLFETACTNFLNATFRDKLGHLRPGDWDFSGKKEISNYLQYSHLSMIKLLADQHRELKVL